MSNHLNVDCAAFGAHRFDLEADDWERAAELAGADDDLELVQRCRSRAGERRYLAMMARMALLERGDDPSDPPPVETWRAYPLAG